MTDFTNNDLFSSKPQYLLVEENAKNYEQNSEYTMSFFDAVDKLKSKGKRPIPFQEIALAVLYCSCEENCNPDFNRKEILNINTQNTQTPSIVFAVNTETQSDKSNTQEQSIPATEEYVVSGSESEIPDTNFSIPESIISIYKTSQQEISPNSQVVKIVSRDKVVSEDDTVPSGVKSNSLSSISNHTKASVDATQKANNQCVGNPLQILQRNTIQSVLIKKRLPEDDGNSASKKKNNNPFSMK